MLKIFFRCCTVLNSAGKIPLYIFAVVLFCCLMARVCVFPPAERPDGCIGYSGGRKRRIRRDWLFACIVCLLADVQLL